MTRETKRIFTKAQPALKLRISQLAEGVGFEPTDELPHLLISSQVH